MAEAFCSGYPDPPSPRNPLENLCACALAEVDQLVEAEVTKRLATKLSCAPCELLGRDDVNQIVDPCDKDYVPPPYKCRPATLDMEHLRPCLQKRRDVLAKRRAGRKPINENFTASLKAAEQALALHYGDLPNLHDLVYETSVTARPGVGRLQPGDMFLQGSMRDRIRAEISYEDEPWNEFYPALLRNMTLAKLIVFLEQLDEDVRGHEVLKHVSGKSYLKQEMKLIDDYLVKINEKYFGWLRSLEDASTDPSVVSQFDSYELARKEWLHKLRQQRELDEMISYQLNRLAPVQGMKTETYFKKVKAGKRLLATANNTKELIQQRACRADRLQDFVQRTLSALDEVISAWGQFSTDSSPPTGVCVILEAILRVITKKPSEAKSDLKEIFQSRRVPMFRNLESFTCTVLSQSEQLVTALRDLQTRLTTTTDPSSARVPPSSNPAGDGQLCQDFAREYNAELNLSV